MGKSQRTKGHSFERWVARSFNEAMPGLGAKRGFQTRGGAGEDPDVITGIWDIECKVGKKPPIRAALVGAVKYCKPGHVPLVVIKEDRKTPFVVMVLDDWLEMASEWWEMRNE